MKKTSFFILNSRKMCTKALKSKSVLGHKRLVSLENVLLLTYQITALVAVFGVQGFETSGAVGLSISHDVSLSSQHFIAFVTAEMIHVPVSAFRFRTLVREYYLK